MQVLCKNTTGTLNELLKMYLIKSRPWYYLTLPTAEAFSNEGHAFFSDIVKKNLPTVLEMHNFNVFQKAWVDELTNRLGNTPSSIMIFFRPANLQWPTAHVDLNTNEIKKTNDIRYTISAINLLYNGQNDDSKMIWYQCPELKLQDIQWSNANTAYLEVDTSKLEEIDVCRIGNNLTLVRTDIPHNIIMGEVPRLCISIRFSVAKLNNPTWDRIVEQYRNNLVLE